MAKNQKSKPEEFPMASNGKLLSAFFRLNYGLAPLLLFVSVGAVLGAIHPYESTLLGSVFVGAAFFLAAYFLMSGFVVLFSGGEC